MKPLYTSDTHIGHAKIIGLCGRPFGSVEEMDQRLIEELLRAARTPGTRIIHGGDFAWSSKQFERLFPEGLPGRENHAICLGNHDRGAKGGKTRRTYERCFGSIVGIRESWRANEIEVEDTLAGKPVKILVTHHPRKTFPGYFAFNVYGHIHNNALDPKPENLAYWAANPESDDRWVLGSPRHLNACVELTDYRPMTLEELVERQEER